MPLNNLLSPRNQVETASGRPLSGGLVFLFEPGTTTPVPSHKDAALTQPNENPVRLSGSGRANIWVTRDVDMIIRTRDNASIVIEELNANPDALAGSITGGLVPNASFELDADNNGVPDAWLLSSESGATNAIDATESTDGAQSFRFTSGGAGGGSLVTEGFFPVNDVEDLRISFDIRSTNAAIRNIVRVEWFDVSQVPISNTDAYDSTTNPTVFMEVNVVAAPPTGARFARLRLIGGDPSVPIGGSTFFDRLNVFYPEIVIGVFDNITVRDSEIITTGANTSLELAPNGTGSVNISKFTDVNILNTSNALNLGTNTPDTAPHLALGTSRVQAKADAVTPATLGLNTFGGDVLVSKSVSNLNTAGVEFQENGLSAFTRAGDVPVIVNRLTDDGDLIRLRRLGDVVGALRSNTGGNLELNSTGNLAVNSAGEVAVMSTGDARITAGATSPVIFGRGGSESARFDPSGQLLVGKTVASSATVGSQILPIGAGVFTRASGLTMVLNRLGSDGEVLRISHDDTTVFNVQSLPSGGARLIANAGDLELSSPGGDVVANGRPVGPSARITRLNADIPGLNTFPGAAIFTLDGGPEGTLIDCEFYLSQPSAGPPITFSSLILLRTIAGTLDSGASNLTLGFHTGDEVITEIALGASSSLSAPVSEGRHRCFLRGIWYGTAGTTLELSITGIGPVLEGGYLIEQPTNLGLSATTGGFA